MKTPAKPVLTVTFLILLLAGINGCKEDVPQTPQQVVTAQLTAGTWRLETVLIEGEDGAQLFNNFTLVFTETGYTSTGTTPVWRRQGTWTFLNEEATRINRDGEVDVDIVSIDDTTLRLALIWNQETFEGGRSQSLRGRHEFTLRKQ